MGFHKYQGNKNVNKVLKRYGETIKHKQCEMISVFQNADLCSNLTFHVAINRIKYSQLIFFFVSL